MAGIQIERMLVKDVMSSTPVTAEKGEKVSEVLARMKKTHLREIPVLEDGKVIGLVGYPSLLLRRSLPLASRVEQVMLPVPRLEENMPLTSAVEELMSAGVRGAPILRNGKMVGFISRTDVIRILPNVDQLKEKKVGDFMSKTPQAVTEKDSVRKAEMMMKGLMEKTLPVVDDKGDLVGSIGMHDAFDAIWSHTPEKGMDRVMSEREAPDVAVGSLMGDAVSVTPDSTIGQVAQTMIENDLVTVFVKQDGKLVGVVSQADLMEQIISLKPREGVYVQITGLTDVDPDIYDTLYGQIEKAMNRIDKIQFPRVFSVHVSTYNHEGLRAKYSVQGRLTTDKGMYWAKAVDWDLYKTMDTLLGYLEKNVKKEHEKLLEMRKKKQGL